MSNKKTLRMTYTLYQYLMGIETLKNILFVNTFVLNTFSVWLNSGLKKIFQANELFKQVTINHLKTFKCHESSEPSEIKK